MSGKVFQEGDLRFDFSRAVDAIKFDDTTHGLSRCMKAVDFVIETDNAIFFVEVKDPGHPHATEEQRALFQSELKSGTLIQELTPKARDSFLYQYAQDRIHKPVHYLAIIGLNLALPTLTALKSRLEKHIPVKGPQEKDWKKPFIHSCSVFTIETWNNLLPDYPITRLSAAS